MLRALLNKLGAPNAVAIPEASWDANLAALPFVARLDAGERARLRELASRFLAEKEMSGADGLELTAAIQVNIAMQACLPVLNLGLEWYRGWVGVIVYPSEFVVPRRIVDHDSVVHEFDDALAGEAWDGGPVLLSWDDARAASAEGYGTSVAIHEFTHKLDMLNGEPNGQPPFDARLHAGLRPREWRAVLDEAFARLNAELDLIEAEIPADLDPASADADRYFAALPLDPYAAQDEAEFFAVSSEAFFVAPARLRDAFPAWYDVLAQFFRQDPLAR
ncbi:MAG: zinc-dependent peptidase [Betaproteobacteria bacterium]